MLAWLEYRAVLGQSIGTHGHLKQITGGHTRYRVALAPDCVSRVERDGLHVAPC